MAGASAGSVNGESDDDGLDELVESVLTQRFNRHSRVPAWQPDAEIILSQPGLGQVLGALVLAEFGDDRDRYADAKSHKNYAGTSPITRASGKKKAVLARFVHNDRLIDALMTQAFSALNASPGARAYYDQLRARGARTQRRPAAARQPAATVEVDSSWWLRHPRCPS